MAQKRIYAVTVLTTPQTIRLVKAHTAAEARRHVWDRLTTVEMATQDECVKLGNAGVEVEVAGDSPTQGSVGAGAGTDSAISQLPIADAPAT
jgi:hypothetical protein